mgnify:CR=1 FL=1
MAANETVRNALTLPVCLIIMDGLGLAEPGPGNAVSLANTPTLDYLFETCSWTKLAASGEAVGLPAGQMGNSEVGHLNIGAGRVVHQELSRINMACRDGSICENEVINQAIEAAKKPGAALHLMGLLSDGGVHSSNEHLFALIRHAVRSGASDVRVHAFMDGRDVPPASGKDYMAELVSFIESNGFADVVRIASVSGRYYAMDRDKRWERVQKAFDAIVCAEPCSDISADAFMQASYDNDVTDEFVVPGALDARGVLDGDAVVFFNFRPDRAREITRALIDPEFDGFARKGGYKPVTYVSMTQYDATMPNVLLAYPPESLHMTMGEYLSKMGKTQLRIAETEKYAHVTFFFNGGRETPFEEEDRILVPSPKVATYDLKPEMSAYEVKDKLVAAIGENKYDFIVVNYANGDMVGHTGVYSAIEKAVVAIDACVRDTVEAAKANGYEVIIIADHGNADNAENADGTPNTAHSLNPVPFVYVTENKNARVEDGILADVAPSICHIMGLPQPAEMTGHDLLK